MPYKDPEEHRRKNRERSTARRVKWFIENGPCKHCGSWDDLELDHIDPATKIDHKIWSWTDLRREEELKKCQPLCYDCHKAKTKLMHPIKHGTDRAYCARQCRCGACTEAHRIAIERWRGA